MKVLAKRGGRGGGRGARGAGRGGRGGALRGQGTGRGGVRAGGVADARQAILSKQRSGMVDARDKLVKMAKTGGDARKKLDKIRNLKAGKLEVKKRGGVTITTTTKGKLLLTTKKKEAASKKGNNPPSRGNLTRRVGRGGAISITTKKTPSVLKQQQQQQQQRRPAAAAAPARKTPASPGRGGGGRGRGARRPAPAAAPISPSRPITRTIKGELTESARLDEELLNTHVDPLVLKRTIRQQSSSRQAPPERRYVPSRMISEDAAYYDRRRDRSRSPMDYEEEGGRGRGSRRYDDFDDPRRGAEEDSFRRGMFRQVRHNNDELELVPFVESRFHIEIAPSLSRAATQPTILPVPWPIVWIRRVRALHLSALCKAPRFRYETCIYPKWYLRPTMPHLFR